MLASSAWQVNSFDRHALAKRVAVSKNLVSPMAPSADPLPRSWAVPSPPTQQTAAAADHNLVHRWTVPLGSIAGIPIRLHVLFLVAVFLGVLSSSTDYWQNMVWAVVLYGPILLVTVLLHELGHCLASRWVGAEVHGILLWPLGGLAFVGHTATPGKDLLVALAGPLTHVPQTLIWLLIMLPIYKSQVGSFSGLSLDIPSPSGNLGLAIVVGAVQLNLYLMAFNLLLPAYPLDGGRILADLLLLCHMSEALAAKIVMVLALVGAIGIAVWGWLSASILTIAVAVWMLWSTVSLIQAVRHGTAQSHPMFNYAQQQQRSPPSPSPGDSSSHRTRMLGSNPNYSAPV